MSKLIDVHQLAFLFGITDRWVQRMADEHGMPREEHGMYDPIRCTQWYTNFLRAQMKSANFDQKARLTKATADMRELELARRRGELVEARVVERVVADFVLASKARLLGLPDKLAARLAAEKRPAGVKKSCRRNCSPH